MYQLVVTLTHRVCIKISLHFSIRFHIAQDGHHHLVIHPAGQVQVVWHALIRQVAREEQ